MAFRKPLKLFEKTEQTNKSLRHTNLKAVKLLNHKLTIKIFPKSAAQCVTTKHVDY